MSVNLLLVEVGQSVAVTATVVDPTTEQEIDAATAKWTLNPPDDVVSSDNDSTSHPATGIYIYQFTVNQRGTWGVRFRTTGPDTVAECHITGDWSAV